MTASNSGESKMGHPFALAVASVFAMTVLVSGQAKPGTLPLPLETRQQSNSESPAFTFTAVTRMVIVEVVARDREDNPVRNLTAADLQISESIDGSKGISEKIASFRPVNDVAAPAENKQGIVLPWLHTSYCPLAGAYELSYYLSPESRKDGLHRISVSSARSGIRLFFRPGYRIEADKPAQVEATELATKQSNSSLQKQQLLEAERKKHPELEVALIACYDTLRFTDFNLQLRKVLTEKVMDEKGRTQGLSDTFEFIVPASYFTSLSASDREHSRQLDFSFCTFEPGGQPLRHFEGTVKAESTREESGAIPKGGIAHSISIPEERCHPEGTELACIPPMTELDWQQGFVPKFAFSARLVVRDRESGAVGSAEILLLPLGKDQFPVPIPEGQTNESFGTRTPETPLAMCGDIYQLAPWTTRLPLFSELDSTAPIYATSLGVYSRFFTAGIPGVTSRTEWFGVNYQGSFGVEKPGKYEFDLLSDDGAKVYIDDKLVVSDDTLHPAKGSRGKTLLTPGAHNIRVSYFQGPRTEVALVLLVKPPGRAWRLFDTRDFPSPEQPAYERKKLPLPGE